MRPEPAPAVRVGLALALLSLCALLFVPPYGELRPVMEERWDHESDRPVLVHDDARMRAYSIANSAGQVATLLTLGSLVLPRVRRPWATKLHRRLGAGILALAALHMAIYFAEGSTRGWLPGLLALAAFAAHGVTGALKQPFLRAWGPEWWRLIHRGSGYAALALVVVHILLANWHLGLARWLPA